MKRTKKLLILLGVLIVVCAASFAASKLNPELSTGSGDTESSAVFTLDANSVTVLSFRYTGSLSFERDNGTWYSDDDPDFPLDGTRIDRMVSAISSISAERTIDDPAALSEYGLSDPICQVTVSTGSGEESVLSFGNEAELGGSRYMSTGDGKVYLVDKNIIDSFDCGLYDLVTKELLPDMSNIVSFTVESGDSHYELDHIENSGLAYSDDYVWFYKDGDDYLTLDTALTKAFTGKITWLTWGECVNYKANDDDLKAYGLADPAAVVKVNYIESSEVATNMTDSSGSTIYDTQETEHTFKLEIGSYLDDKCYARIAGSQMVYLIDGTICDNLLHATYESLQPDEVLDMDWDTVDSVDVDLTDDSVSFVKSENADGETVWLLDGEEKELQPILDRLNEMLPSDSGSEKEPDMSMLLRFTFHRNTDKFRTVVLEFYDYDSGNCLVSLDGTARLLVSRSDLSALLESVRALV